jgi:hypothetical protein
VVYGHINNSDSISKIVSKADVENFSQLVYILVFALFVAIKFSLKAKEIYIDVLKKSNLTAQINK